MSLLFYSTALNLLQNRYGNRSTSRDLKVCVIFMQLCEGIVQDEGCHLNI